MTIYYVDAVSGNDSWAGTMPATAWRTQANVNSNFSAGNFNPGDQILFKRGQTHSNGSINVRGSSGASGSPIVLGAYGSGVGRPIIALSGGASYVIGRWLGNAAANWITIQDWEVDADTITSGGVWLEDATNWVLRRVCVRDAGPTEVVGIMIRKSATATLEYVEVYDTYGEGIYVGRYNDINDNPAITLQDSYIHDNDSDGIDLKPGTRDCQILRTVFRRNGAMLDDADIVLGGADHLVEDCYCVGNNAVGIRLGTYLEYEGSGENITVRRCMVNGQGQGFRVRGTGNDIDNCTIVNCTTGANVIGSNHTITKTIIRNCTTNITGTFATTDTYTNDPSFIDDILYAIWPSSPATGYGWWEAEQKKAIAFDESNDYYSIADDASLTLPNGDWCVGFWARLDDDTGSAYQYAISNNGWSAPNSLNIYFCEVGLGAAYTGKWMVQLEDGDGTDPLLEQESPSGADGRWRLIIVQRNTTENRLELWTCEENQAPLLTETGADTALDAVNGGNWNIGRRTDGDAARYFGGMLSQFFKGNFCLTDAEIEDLGEGQSILDIGKSPSIFLEMDAPDATLTDESGNGNAATRYGAPYEAISAPYEATSPDAPGTTMYYAAATRSCVMQILLFDRWGAQLAEIEPEIEYVYWRLNNVGRAKFSLPYADPKCTRDNLRPGNRLLLRFGNGLPDWGGVIGLPRRRTSTGMTVTGYTGEWLLGWRYTAKGRYFSNAVPGTIFDTLINEENAEYPTGIVPYSCYGAGTARTIEYHYHQLLKRCRDLARMTGHDFQIAPHYEDGALTFRSYWYERRGADVSGQVQLIEDVNADIVLDEQGPIINRVILAGSGSTWGSERIDAMAEEAASRAEYGCREWAAVQGGVEQQATLDANAEALLAEMAYPRDRFSIYALDKAPATFAAYGVGDIVGAQAFFKSREFCYDGAVRVVAREWTPWNVCRLEVEVWRE